MLTANSRLLPCPLRVFDPEAPPYAEWAAQILSIRQLWWALHREDPAIEVFGLMQAEAQVVASP
jgi:hypothetical protein